MPASPDGPILVIEDDATTRDAFRALLEVKGYTAVVTDDAETALKCLRTGLAPSLILLDLMLSGRDGFDFRREQKADPDLAPIPVVAYSGLHNIHYAALELGSVAVLEKPFDAATLLEAIETHRYRG
jgi:CheY-like chemotaxis protein